MAGNDKIIYSVGFDVQQENLKQLKATLDQLKKQLTDIKNVKIGDIAKINNVDIEKAREYLNDIQNQAVNVESALKKTFNTKLNTINISQFNKILKDSGSSIQKVYADLKKAGPQGEQAFRSLANATLHTNIQLKQSHAVLNKIAQTLTKTLGWNLASSAVNSLTRSVQQAWGYVKSLDTSLNNISIVTGKSADQMADFAVKANDAAKALGKTTTDYTNAALIYAQQGLSDKEVEARTDITLKAANVTGQSTEAVSQELTAVWNGYKVNADEAELYVDRLAAVAATTASDLEELSTGMSKVASAAAAMGVGEDQLAAQLSTIISVTKQAPESVGTALRTVYARISDIQAGIEEDGVTLGNYSGEMAKLGFNVLDTSGHLRDMGAVIEQIGSGWQNLTRQQQINLAQVMAGQRQYSNLIALFDNFQQYNKALETAQNAEGTLQSQQDIYMESTAAHLNQLKASVEDIYDSLIDADGMDNIIDDLTTLANLVANFVDSLGGGGQMLKSLGAIGVMAFSTQIAKGINTTITNIQTANSNAKQLEETFKQIAKYQNTTSDPVTKKLLDRKQQMVSMSRFMTPQQFNQAQTSLEQLSNKMGRLQQVGNKLNDIENLARKAGIEIKNMADLPEQLGEISQISKLTNTIDELRSKDISSQAKDFQSAQVIGQQIMEQIGQGAEGALGKTQEKIKQLVDNLMKAPLELGEEASEADWEALADSYAEQLQEIRDAAFSSEDRITSEQASAALDLQVEIQDVNLGELQEQFESLQDQVEDATNNANNFGDVMQRAFTIESITMLIGSVGSLAMGIQQLQNLGGIWANKDISVGQKIFQTITNVSMSVGMLIPAILNLKKAYDSLNITQGISSALSTAHTMAEEGATAAEIAHKIATDALRTAQEKLNAVMATSSGAFYTITGIIVAAVAAYLALVRYQEEVRKNTIENSHATIEETNAIQENLQAHKELYNSLDELDKKYQEGQISRIELRSQVDNLIDQYDLEDDKIQDLKNSYTDLTNAIIKLREVEANEKLLSAGNEAAAAKAALIATAQGMGIDKNTLDFGNSLGGMYNAGGKIGEIASIIPGSPGNILNALFPNQKVMHIGNFFDAISQKDREIFTQTGLDYISMLNVGDEKALTQYYDKIIEAKKLYEENFNFKELENNSYYQDLKNIAQYLHQDAQEYKQNQQELAKYEVELNSWQAEKNGELNFQNVNSGIDYINERMKLINKIETEFSKSRQDAEKLADTYLKENFNSIYSQFSELSTYTDKLEKQFGNLNQTVAEMLGNLTPEQLAFIEDIDISSWKQLKNVLEYMATTDFSNLNIIANPQAAIQSAKSNYNRYKELSNQYYGDKQISIKKDEDFDKLAPQVQSFFETMEDGTHVMTGNAKEFNKVVKQLEIQDFKQINDALRISKERLDKISQLNIEDYSESAISKFREDSYSIGGTTVFSQNSTMAQYLQQQLDILTQFGHDVAEIAGWQAQISDGEVTTRVIHEIASAVDDYTNQINKLTQAQKINKDAIYQNQLALGKTAESMKELRQYLDQGLIDDYRAFNKAAIDLDESLDLEGLDRKELEDFGDHLQQIADSSDDLANSLQTDEEAAEIVAKSIIKMNKGVETLAKNWENWSDLLKNSSDSSKEYSDAMSGTKEAMADLLDINKDFISENFIKEHLAEIGEAAKGSETAIDSLKSALSQDIIARIMLENGIKEEDQAAILASLESLQATIPNIEVGTSLETGAFLEQAQALIDACGMTADQANALFDSIGFEATFATEPQQVTQRTPNMVTETQVTGYTSGWVTPPTLNGSISPLKIPWSYPILKQNTYQNGYTEHTGIIDVPAMSTNGKTPKITSLTKKAGGSFNNGSSRNAGGNNSGKGSGKGGGGKGGGSGKAPQPDTSQKDRKKDVEDTRDIYHDINIELEQINRRLDRAQKKQDRLYGKQLLDNLNEQTRILEEHKAALEEKHRIQEQDLKTQQETLKNLGVTFDEYNNISNYMDILGRKQAQINAETQKYNSLIDAYNASTDKDLKKALSEEAEKINKQIQEYDNEYKDLEKKIKNYDSLRVAMEDVVDQIEEETQKQIEINIKKFRMAVEIQLEMGQAERDWNKFRREVLEHTDVLKGTEFEEIFANARQNFNDVFSYFDVHGTKGSLQALTEQLMATRAEIEAINETGKSAIYGDNKAQAMEDLQKDLDELMGQMEDVQGLIDDIGKAYLDTIDDIADQFDKQIEDYEYVGDLIEHDIDLLSLLYGDKNYDAMQKYYDALARNNLKQLDSLKQQRDFWKQEWEEAVARGDSKAAEEFEQNYKETIENLNDLIEDSAKTIQDKYVNAIDKIFDELDKKISNGKGTDYLSTQWDLMNKNAEEYLDTINSAFAIQETERKYQKAIDESKNIKSQQTLKKLMDDQLNILRNKEKVSQYDVDRAEKLLQVEQARIALQDAQSAKTTMRLKRDSQGNYSYQYVADNNAVDDARDNLAQAQNDLYNFDKERYQSVLNDMLSAWKDFQSEYKEILEDTSLAEEERIEKLALLRDEYGEYINDKTAQNAEARNNLMESAFADMAALYNTDVANYNQMSIDEQNILMGDLVPAWESGIQQMSDKVAGEGGFIPVCEQAFDSITEATKDYEEQLDNMANAAGISLDYVTQGVDLLSYAFEDLIENNDDLIDRMYSEVDAIETLQDVARGLVDEYQNVYNEAKTAVSEIHNFIQEEQGRAAAYAETANAAIESYHRTAQAYAEAYDQMASAFENYADRVRAAASGNSTSGGSNGNNGGGSDSTGSSPSSPSSSAGTSLQGKTHTSTTWEGGKATQVNWYYDENGNIIRMASGGYTGNWNSSEGKVAILHQKELVLNEDDTKNFLEGTHILREISSSLQGSISNRISNIGLRSVFSTDKEELEQNVHIEASFPNVNSKKEIEEAFNDLVNLAAQRAMRNN